MGSIQVRHLNILEPSSGAEWDALVESHPASTAFHSSAWGRVLCDTYGHTPRYFYLHSNGEPVALIPLIEVSSPFTGRRGVCLPFTDACGPLAFRADALENIKQQLVELCRQHRWHHCEVRSGDLLENQFEHEPTFYGHTLRLVNEPEALFERFGNGTKGAVKQAIKNGITVDINGDLAAVKDFYTLQVETRRKHGVPPQPFEFFANVHQKMIAAGLGFTVLARSGNQIVAGAIFLRSSRHAIYKFAASHPESGATRGNNLVLWEAIRHLISSGCEQLDFGRTSPEHDGLRRFKLSWGAEEKLIRYSQFEVRHGRWSQQVRHDREGIANSIFRRLPSAANRLAGAMLYPHLD